MTPEVVEPAPARCAPPSGSVVDWLDPLPGPRSCDPVVLEPPEPPAGLVLEPPAGLVLSVGSVEPGGSVVLGVLLVVELAGGSVVVGGSVVLGRCRRGRLDGGGSVLEVVAWLLGGRVTVCPLVVVGGLVEVAGETASRWGRVVVVVWPVALATWPGVVSKPTTLPPIAPISIAVTTLTQRRAATNEIGPKPGPPRFELPDSDDKRHRPAPLEHPRTDTPAGARRRHAAPWSLAAGAAVGGNPRRAP